MLEAYIPIDRRQAMARGQDLPDRTQGTALFAGVATGPARRFQIGNPQIQYIDVLAGATLDRVAAAEHMAERGEVIVSQETAAHVGDKIQVAEWRTEHETGNHYGVVSRLSDQVRVEASPWPDFSLEVLTEEQIRPWLLPPIYERLRTGQGRFLDEIRPTVVLFLKFGGLARDPAHARWNRLREGGTVGIWWRQAGMDGLVAAGDSRDA